MIVMKFLTFTDVHENQEAIEKLVQRASKKDIQFTVCAGDISTFGRGLKKILGKFNAPKKTFYFIPGNHEEGIDLDDAAKEFSHCIPLHRKAVRLENYWFLGYGGGGFSQEDTEFRKLARQWYGSYKGEKMVFVTHGPPADTKVDLLQEHHVGSIDYRKFVERIKPKLHICGHLHETVGVTDKIGETKVVNPGLDGMVIELK